MVYCPPHTPILLIFESHIYIISLSKSQTLTFTPNAQNRHGSGSAAALSPSHDATPPGLRLQSHSRTTVTNLTCAVLLLSNALGTLSQSSSRPSEQGKGGKGGQQMPLRHTHDLGCHWLARDWSPQVCVPRPEPCSVLPPGSSSYL